MARPKTLITKSELAAFLRLSPGRVSQLVSKGLPVRADGKVSRDEAVAWYRANVREATSDRKRGPRPKAVAAALAGGACEADAAHEAVVDTLRLIAAPSESLRLARAALLIGCTPVQAYGLALWFSCQVVGPVDVEPEEVSDFQEPEQRDWKQLLGADFDFAGGEALFEKISAADAATA